MSSKIGALPQTEIAVIFDCDITLIRHYMQDPIFQEFRIKAADFWSDVKRRKKEGYDDEHAYMRELVEYVRTDRIGSLSNAHLKALGEKLEFYDGFPKILDDLRSTGESDDYAIGDLRPSVKFYVISSGLEEMIAGSKVAPYLKKLWGCTFDEDESGSIAFPKETISHTMKTQKLFLINKGLLSDGDRDRVNDYVPTEGRPVPFEHMVYLGDGPSDVPCFSLVRKNGGRAIAVYAPENQAAFDKCYQLVVEAARADVMCPADYTKGSHLYLALHHTVRRIASEIAEGLKAAAKQGVIPAPGHSTGANSS